MKRVLIILTIMTLAAAAHAQGLRVRERVVVQDENVFFKDVVEGELPDSIAGTFLVRAPSYGSTATLNGSFIQARFRQAGGNAELLSAPKVMQIERAFQIIPYTVVEHAAKEWILRQRSEDELTIKFPSAGKDVAAPPGPMELKVTLNDGYAPMGRQSIPVDIIVGDRVFKTVRVDSFIDADEKLVAARHSIPKGRIIAAEDITLKSVSASRIRGRAYRDPEMIVGKAAKTALSAGELIRDRHIETAPVVRRGDVVCLVLRTPSLSVKAYGVAMDDAGVGEMVKVKNLDTKVRVLGRVQDAQTVRVEM